MTGLSRSTYTRVRAKFDSPAGGLRQPYNQAHRVLACCVIILGHCEAAVGIDASPGGRLFQLALNIWAQYAVPFFLVLAGYTLAPKLTRSGAARHAANYSRRIFTVFVVTTSFYFLLNALGRAKPGEAIGIAFDRETERLWRDPSMLFLGTAGHLWFLVALILAVWTTAWVRSRTRLRYLVVFGFILYAALLVTGPYAIVFGFEPLPQAWRYTLFLGTPFVMVGLVLRHARIPPPVRVAYALIVAGVLCQIAEQYWLWSRWSVSPFETGTLMGTAPQAVGISMLAVQSGGSAVSRLLARLGPLTLFTYLIHVAFVDVLRPYRFEVDRVTVRWLYPFVVALLSFTCAAAYYTAVISVRQYFKQRAAGTDGRRTPSSDV